MLKKLFKWFKYKQAGPKIIPRPEHGISREKIDNNALKVLYRLHKAGYQAYLVGGCLRDCLLGLQPKDFDIATNASPDQIKDLFINCRLIGRRFRLAHIHFGRNIIEVATFRAQHVDATQHNAQGMIVHDNVYGSMEEDVMRRDFTVNSLYYNIADFSLVDFVDAMNDLQNKRITLIGDPQLRYREDPVRMLRAIRFAAKLDFSISPDTAKPIKRFGNLLANIPPARIFEEFNKLFLHGNAAKTYKMLCEYKLLTHMFPLLINYTNNNSFIETALHNTDNRVQQGKPVAPSFVIAVLYWQPLLEQVKNFRELPEAIDKLLSQQQRIMAVPRRLLSMVRDIWQMQWRLQRKLTTRGVKSIYTSPKFRAGYDFLLLRAATGDTQVSDTASWWQTFVEATEEKQEQILLQLAKNKPRRRTRKAKKAPSERS